MSPPRTVAVKGADLHRGSAGLGISPHPCIARDGRVAVNPGNPS
jgi:hypothetical protein